MKAAARGGRADAGGINADTGSGWTNQELTPQRYLVNPPAALVKEGCS
jgi:hypothetical protein